MGEIVGAFFSTAFSFAIPDKYQAIEASQVAKGMIACMNSEETGLHILESDDIMSK